MKQSTTFLEPKIHKCFWLVIFERGFLLKFPQSDSSSTAAAETSSTAETQCSQGLCEANVLNGKDLLGPSEEY